MLRRAAPAGGIIARWGLSNCNVSIRHGRHGLTRHDFSNVFSRSLTEEEMKALQQQQEYRPVSAVVPGKLFMRHWIAGEQATESVVDRVISGFVFVCFMLWGCGFATLGFNGNSCAHTAVLVFIAYWLYLQTHCRLLISALATLAVLHLIVN
ncbi:uncharacterized protein TEOVI_000849000 [Trypanosoma equiperdum]|uniref:Uncharacterized protein n=4 Tax=Trypanozoon TaxID=39700 RepID=Q57WH4_TRYB2|nr:hypothetical protein, conserved [Trypanosoma brucei gambiense DAL972]XP_845982.1 hypothetical protein, conserved [Trypanosoma brucei brucei TREU927]AAX70047.1 hypothetical protein, conserved [Trypanosoma brucei]RHW71324.1 hypothetical protein DPX39_070046000 [Trypanosoma brucei equiperdum]SCU67154.1 hypothetical protein, conserved [Trypanosoma equiperdum]AAZ12423.1 hypothetical protein, conserved [Trypanosoma brucei brucei TREU927]CBH12464.1 hypothetical protein, conserved [Trypanosoma bru|eukprot:XP_011774744.1 hypothetical protein, conserved [Trypanosoma brucei gambiense DAL972]